MSAVVGEVNVSGTDPSQYLQPFNMYAPATQNCTDLIHENRFNLNFTNTSTGKQDKFYCWQGIIAQQPQCVIGSVCSQYSYTEARTAFCQTWGREPGGCAGNQADLYVPNEGTADANVPVVNERGGIIAYNPAGSCQGTTTVGGLQCMVNSLRQSFAHVLDPKNEKNLIIAGIVGFAFLLIVAFYGKNIRNKLPKSKDVFSK